MGLDVDLMQARKGNYPKGLRRQEKSRSASPGVLLPIERVTSHCHSPRSVPSAVHLLPLT